MTILINMALLFNISNILADRWPSSGKSLYFWTSARTVFMKLIHNPVLFLHRIRLE